MDFTFPSAVDFRRRRTANSIPVSLAARIAKIDRGRVQRFESGTAFLPAHVLLRMHNFFMLAEALLARRRKIVRFSDSENTECVFASWLAAADADAILVRLDSARLKQG
jgi:hypothetical protein